MSIALAQIENAFVKSLARDYEKVTSIDPIPVYNPYVYVIPITMDALMRDYG